MVPWPSATDAANFVAFWRQIVTTMRAVPGQQFKFLWNPSADSPTSYSPDQAYPGNAYVDYVGTDVYDKFWGSPFTPAAAWANQLTQQWGLDWLASFAAAHGKPIAIPEWSVEYRTDGHGLGDDPSFIDQHGRLVRGPQRGLRRHLLLRLRSDHVPKQHPRRHASPTPWPRSRPTSADLARATARRPGPDPAPTQRPSPAPSTRAGRIDPGACFAIDNDISWHYENSLDTSGPGHTIRKTKETHDAWTHANERTPRPSALGRWRMGRGPGQLARRRAGACAAATSAPPCSARSPTGPAHGYELIGRLEEKSGGTWRPSPGSVYPTLQLFEDEGLVRSEQRDGKRVYELTDAGRTEAADRVERFGNTPWDTDRRRRSPSSRGS